MKPGEVEIVSWSSDRADLRATGPGWLVLSEIVAPDWVATIDGEATDIFITDLTLRGVYVPWGEHTITFDYQPRRVYAGVLISVLKCGGGVGVSVVSGEDHCDNAMRSKVTRREWRWVVIWIVVALIVTSVPYLVGWLRSTPDRVFGGFAFAIEDGYSYLSKMKQGAEGLWLFQLPYTSEAHTPTIFYLFYLLLGKFSALTGLSTPLVYHLARLLFDAILLAVIYRFIALFTAWRPVRRIAFLLIIFSGGLGWLLILLGQATGWTARRSI